MRKEIGLLLVVVLGTCFGVWLMTRESRVWTTESQPAMEAFEEGLEANMRLYHNDAAQSFERALEYDPDFVAAHLMMLGVYLPKEERELHIQALRNADGEALSPRERHLISIALARMDGSESQVREEVIRFADEFPDDPYAAHHVMQTYFRAGEFERAAQACYRLVELDPNWALAYNQLGYIHMNGGEFLDAEKALRTYRFLAPDQANPYDSLGELFMISGRYDEAIEQFESALEIKADFWASYEHLIQAKFWKGDLEGALELVDAAVGKNEELAKIAPVWRCNIEAWSQAGEGRWEAAWNRVESCRSAEGKLPFDLTTIAHRAAVMTGRFDAAVEIEASIAAKQHDQLLSSYLGAIRAIGEGELDEAVRVLSQIDSNTGYIAKAGWIKLTARLDQASALEALGRHDEAERLMAEVAEVNEHFAQTWGRWTELAVVAPEARPDLADIEGQLDAMTS